MVNYKTLLNQAKVKCNEQGIESTRAEWLMLDLFNWSKANYLMHMDDEVTLQHKNLFDDATQRMLNDEPIQYILGKQAFYGEVFKVNKHCLIPRPETEEVMLHFYNQLHSGDCVVDIGTGSGNIPISLKKLDPSLEVYATDLYTSALSVAKANAKMHQVEIRFLLGDTLMPLIEHGIKVNGLISNPPYIDDNDALIMDNTVLNYEPHTALFAKNNGYDIYDKIIDQLREVLLPNAKVVFEIGFNQGQTLKQRIIEKYPSLDVQIIKDINNNDRIISFVW
ncbi:protein-(glutamine-N5) methyltransferase, release factor-specific [Staphylococcus saprophyticus]|uniref:peptide chain release factor N(5)-glutamine methyltransferase n=1 Tax=Staphylococcus saprophyticus TaxID=29385 RepID=UPI000853A083|nr:peptide chain release factor N(5)-glutamine methyltransferase [Staphylococcus saprophyticus]MDW4396829.1 peptide chain release factor N(5)-glutamine methyltransferase [Staphylococcus saprophyticus]OEK37633.1 protein-(glutamine-N5) methyltransferase, release factor-specific [Staphylococcus saprophyticus]